MVSMSGSEYSSSITLLLMWTFRSTHSLRAPFLFRSHQVALAPGCTVAPSSQAFLWSCLVGLKIFCRTSAVISGMSFTCVLYPLTAGSFSSHTELMPSSGSMSLPSSPVLCQIAQLQIVVANTYSRSNQHHMLLITEAPIDEHHGPPDVSFSHLTEVCPQSGWMIS